MPMKIRRTLDSRSAAIALRRWVFRVTQGAKNWRHNQALNDLVNGKAAIFPEMAIPPDKAFGGGAETWLRLQAAYDLAQAEKYAQQIKFSRIA